MFPRDNLLLLIPSGLTRDLITGVMNSPSIFTSATLDTRGGDYAKNVHGGGGNPQGHLGILLVEWCKIRGSGETLFRARDPSDWGNQGRLPGGRRHQHGL